MRLIDVALYAAAAGVIVGLFSLLIDGAVSALEALTRKDK